MKMYNITETELEYIRETLHYNLDYSNSADELHESIAIIDGHLAHPISDDNPALKPSKGLTKVWEELVPSEGC